MSCRCCESVNKIQKVDCIYEAKVFDSFCSGEKVIELCRLHDIELFKVGEKKFFKKYKSFFLDLLATPRKVRPSVMQEFKQVKERISYEVK